MGGRPQHRDTNCCQPSGRYLAVSRMPACGQQDSTGRKPDVFLQKVFTDFANMEQSWTSKTPILSSIKLRSPAAR